MSRTDELNMPIEEQVVLGQEAAQSITIQLYYKGYSILLTGRDPNSKLAPILQKAMEAIDKISEHPDMQPSWNIETNKAVKETKTVQQSIPVTEFQQMCPNCNIPKIKSKKGNMYCPNRCWIK